MIQAFFVTSAAAAAVPVPVPVPVPVRIRVHTITSHTGHKNEFCLCFRYLEEARAALATSLTRAVYYNRLGRGFPLHRAMRRTQSPCFTRRGRARRGPPCCCSRRSSSCPTQSRRSLKNNSEEHATGWVSNGLSDKTAQKIKSRGSSTYR